MTYADLEDITAPSYVGETVPAECPKCESQVRITPRSYKDGLGHCPKCDDNGTNLVEWEYL